MDFEVWENKCFLDIRISVLVFWDVGVQLYEILFYCFFDDEEDEDESLL